MPGPLRLASRWIAIAAIACACGNSTAPGPTVEAAPVPAKQLSLEEAGGFDRLATLSDGVEWLRGGNRMLVVRDPQVTGHQVVVKVDPCSTAAKPLCRGLGEEAAIDTDGDADFTVIVPVTKDAEAGKRLLALAFQGPDSAKGGYWRYAPDWENHEIANLVESIFRRAWLSPIDYRIVVERHDLGAG